MASSKEYLDFILDQLTGLEGISYRAMMVEYILYYKNKVMKGQKGCYYLMILKIKNFW